MNFQPSKKWTIIQPLRTQWDIPPLERDPNFYDNNAFYTISRLLRADAYHIDCPVINEDSDIYFLIAFDPALMLKELNFIRKMKAMGKKVVLAFSQDYRFLIGDALVSPEGVLYTDLVKEADLTMAGVSSKLKIYGRYQNKVIEGGPFLEDLNFNAIPHNERKIDVLLSGPVGEQGFGLVLELMLTIKDRFPNDKIVYSLRPGLEDRKKIMEERGLIVLPPPLMGLIPNSKYYLDSQIRPRPGRVLDECFYCHTPFISHDLTYMSKLYPEFAYTEMNMTHIVDLYEKMKNSDYNVLIQKASEIAKYDHYVNVITRLEERLYA